MVESLKYEADELRTADLTYGCVGDIRRALDELMPEGGTFILSVVCRKLGIPGLPKNYSRKVYGMDYLAYSRVNGIIKYGIKNGSLVRERRGKYRIVRPFCEKAPVGRPLNERNSLERLAGILDSEGPISISQLRTKAGVSYRLADSFADRQPNVSKVMRPRKSTYGVFHGCFGQSESLLFKADSKANLVRLEDRLIRCLPQSIYTWYEKDIERQLNYMVRHGLPSEIGMKVKSAYLSRMVEDI